MKNAAIGTLAIAAAVGLGVMVRSVSMNAGAARVQATIEADSELRSVCITPTDVVVLYGWKSTADGKRRGADHTIRAPLAGGPVLDENGAQLAAATPTGFATDAASVFSTVNAFLTAAAAQNRISP